MKKTLIFLFLLTLAMTSFASDLPNRSIFIEGTANRTEHFEYFLRNFREEAIGTGHPLANERSSAGYILHFNVTPDTRDNGDQFILHLSLIRNTDNFEVLSFDFYFTGLDEMYYYNQSIFLRAVSYIPPWGEDDLTIIISDTDRRWRNKWMYLRLSFDYPLTIYALQSTGLIGGMGAYLGEFDAPANIAPVDHRYSMLPGLTAGIEFHLLKIFCVEFNYQLFLGDTRDNMFINMAAGAEAKIPIRIGNFMLLPYGAFTYFLETSPVFSSFPPYAVGGGLQFNARGGRHGAFFVDVKYLIAFEDAKMKNFLGELSPNPEVIHFQRSFIGLGIGYKIGLFNRK
jgi:hypothetical protein